MTTLAAQERLDDVLDLRRELEAAGILDPEDRPPLRIEAEPPPLAGAVWLICVLLIVSLVIAWGWA